MTATVVKKASVLVKQGEKSHAKQLLAEFLKDNPNDAQAWYLLSFCVQRNSQKKYCLNKAIGIKPTYKPARNRLASLSRESKKRGIPKRKLIQGGVFLGAIIIVGLAITSLLNNNGDAAAKTSEDNSLASKTLQMIGNEGTEEVVDMTFAGSGYDDEQVVVETLPLPDTAEAFCVPKDTQRDVAKVIEVPSAASIIVDLNGEHLFVNYIGVNTSILDTDAYSIALETNRTLEGQQVTLIADETLTASDGRNPRYVFIGNTFVNYQLLAWGLGSAVNNPPNDSCIGFFLVAQTDAQDQRLGAWAPPPPDEWQSWPVVPDISPFANLVYSTGLVTGRDPHAFSVIGDCQSLPERFLSRVDWSSYTLPGGYEYLQPTIDWYAGDYSRDFVSVRDSATVATMFSPLWADSNRCKSDESPIECEFRLNNPSIVLISLGTNWGKRSPEEFEKYLREIVEYAIDHHVLPVIATKADATASDFPLNQAMAQVAYDFDIPLWNFWFAVQHMPHQGMNPEDTKGIHILNSAYSLKRVTALQVLHQIRTSVEN